MPPTGPTLVALALSFAVAPHAMAQTDYYNTESHHPLLVEDATPLERHAFELRAAPLTLERRDDGTYIWMLTPELSYGVLPRTHVEIGAALAWRDPGAVGSSGSLAGVDIAVMHQLQLERRTSPALAVALHLAAPAGGLAHDDWLASLRGMATRTLSFARVHLNGEYTAGSSRQARGIRHASRWSAGVAVDRAFPLGSALIAAEIVASKPMGRQAGDVHPGGGPPSTALVWRTGGGARWQWTPRLTMDAGVARALSGPHRGWELTLGLSRSFGARSLVPVPQRPDAAPRGWPIVHDQFYLPAEHNWAFRARYAGADRMFNAFDYGHAILYETLYTRPGAPASRLEVDEYDRITTEILIAPPRLPLEEGAIEIAYAALVPEVKAMFEWAHILHRQLYDVWADDRIADADKDARVAELLRYYRSRSDIAFSTVPKQMELMERQPYSLAFRKAYPKFNGLIWAYHWLQIGLYDALIAGRTPDERQTNVSAAVARFWQMLQAPPEHLPRLMPMGPAVAPLFAARYPEAAVIFDNLHSMHDVVSDILASPVVPRSGKREAILQAGARYRADEPFAMSMQEWREMARVMGAHNMGGPATGFTAELPTPTVPIGATHMDVMGHQHPAPSSTPRHDH
jgi:hypothetical protein